MPNQPTDKLNEIWPKGQQAGDAGKLLEATEGLIAEAVADPNTKVKSFREDLLKALAPTAQKSGAVNPPEHFSEELVIKSMADVREKPVNWLWLNRIPRSAITLFTGNPDTGKTMAYCDIAARVSSFQQFPDNTAHTFGCHVLLMASEDDYARVIKPRLMAAGATLANIAYIDKVEIRQGAKRDERMFAFDQDLRKLTAAIKDRGDQLVIIDPISSYFGRGSMYKAQDIRAVFSPLTALCEEHEVAVVAVEHSSKRTDVAAIHKLAGGVALTAAARAVFVFARVPDEDGQFVMHYVKGNLSKRKIGLRYTIEDKILPTLPDPVPFIKWGADDTGTADDLLAAQKGTEKGSRAMRAKKFLEGYLTEAKLSAEIETDAKKQGISRDALYEAKNEMGIKAFKQGGRWWWPAPPSDKLVNDGEAY